MCPGGKESSVSIQPEFKRKEIKNKPDRPRKVTAPIIKKERGRPRKQITETHTNSPMVAIPREELTELVKGELKEHHDRKDIDKPQTPHPRYNFRKRQ